MEFKNTLQLSTESVRRFDDLGRIVIPKVIRQELGIEVGNAMKITILDGKVILKKIPITE